MADTIELGDLHRKDQANGFHNNRESGNDTGSFNVSDIANKGVVDDSNTPAEDTENVFRPERTKFRLSAIMCALYLALFIAALDQTIVATAIPTISAALNAQSGYTWIGGAYLLGNAAGAPIYSKLSDIWGRKPIILMLIVIFGASSALCALSQNIAMLIAGRAIQGSAGGGLIQLPLITISDLFSVRSRALWIGLFEVMWCLAGGIGPVLGGTLAEKSWRWIWWINLPVCGITFALILTFLDVHNPRTKIMPGLRAIDWFGSFSIIGLTVMLLLGLEFGGETFAWDSSTVICLIVFGALMLLAFIYSEKRLAEYPLMPPHIVKSRSNVSVLVLTFMHGFVFIAGEYYLPLYFQSVREAGPLKSGLLIMPLTVAEALFGMTTGIIIHKTGRYRELMWIGMFILTVGTGLYTMLGAKTLLARVIGFEIIAGAGAGFVFEPPIIAIQAFVQQDDCAAATATLGFIRTLATSSSIVLGGVVFQNGMKMRASGLAASGLPKHILDDLSGGAAAANVMIIRNVKDAAQKLAIKEAFSWSLRNMWIMYAIVGFIGFLANIFISRLNLSKEHTETVTGLKKKK